MKKYTTKTGQNIFDVCVTLYGSIEGLLDLLISNTSMEIEDYGPEELKDKPLTIDTKLSRGVILKYHEIDINSTVLDYLKDNNITVANGERELELNQHSNSETKILIIQNGLSSMVKMKLKSGEATIDWGDYKNSDVIKPEDGLAEVYHVYPSSSKHTIKICGNFEFTSVDFSECNGIVYPTDTIVADEAKYNPNFTYLSELFITTDTTSQP